MRRRASKTAEARLSEIKVYINPHEGQREILSNRKRFNVISCGRRFGKTALAWTLALETIAQKLPVLYTTPTAEDYAKRWREAYSFFKPLIRNVRADDGVFEFVNGASLSFSGLYRYDGIRGDKYKLALIDEAAHSPNLEAAWTQVIRATLTDYEGDAYFLSTPKGDNYFKRLAERAETKPSWAFFCAPTSANPYISPNEIEQAREDLSSDVFAQEYLAQFISLAGARVKRDWLRYGEPPEGAAITFGVDLAISTKSEADYSAIAVLARDADYYYLIDVVRTKSSFHQTKKLIETLAARYRPSVIAIESVQYQASMIQELVRTTSLPIKSARPTRDKVTRFIPIEGKYEHGFILHSKHLARDFEDELLTFPNGAHDDQVDALGYAFEAHATTSFAFSI